jgi:hypothetical protein
LRKFYLKINSTKKKNMDCTVGLCVIKARDGLIVAPENLVVDKKEKNEKDIPLADQQNPCVLLPKERKKARKELNGKKDLKRTD